MRLPNPRPANRRVDYAKVDLGATHNGQVTWRNIFADSKGRYIVDRGKRVRVRRISRSLAGLNYVTAGTR